MSYQPAPTLRADALDNIWICEMGDVQRDSSFERFIDTSSRSL